MDLKYVNPFVASAVTVIQEVVGVTATKKQIFVTKGKESQGGVTIFFNLVGDAEGQIIFDLPPGISTRIAKEMIGLNLNEVVQDDEQKDLFKSAITELGNMISGSAVTKLEENKYDCNIEPPQVYVGAKTKITHASMNTIVIEMNTEVGDFTINLVNKKERYGENVHMLMLKMDSVFNLDIVSKLIPKGFYIYGTDDIDQVGKYYIREKSIDFILIDTDSFSDGLDNIIVGFREISKNPNIKIVVCSAKKDRDFLMSIQQIGVAGFLMKDVSNINSMSNKFINILVRLGVKVNEQRKNIVVKIESDNKFKINIKMPTSGESLSGTIIELGVNEVTFVLDNEDQIPLLSENDEFKDISINLKGKFILADGSIYAIRDKAINIRLDQVKDKFVTVLTDVIFEKISLF